jgi:hypothetical protein
VWPGNGRREFATREAEGFMMQTTLLSFVSFVEGIDPLIQFAFSVTIFIILIEVVYLFGAIIGVLPDESPFRRKH